MTEINSKFTHLHTHSEFSTLDGIIKLKELASRVKELGMSSIALTDHGNLHGVIEFYKECNKEGVKPIIGIEGYCTLDKDGIEDNSLKHRDNYHFLLLAKNNTGLRNLFKLSSKAFIENFYYRPRISIENLSEDNVEGLIATSGCLAGLISGRGNNIDKTTPWQLNEKEFEYAASQFKEIFGDNFFLEVQDNKMEEQDAYNSFLLQLSSKMNIPLIITADAHYLNKSDHRKHAFVMANQLQTTIQEYESGSKGMKYGNEFYIKSPKEMLEGSKRIGAEEAFYNTQHISDMCEVEIELGNFQMPNFDISKTHDYKEFLQWKSQQSTQ